MNEWIRPDDRVPDDDRIVLVTVEYFEHEGRYVEWSAYNEKYGAFSINVRDVIERRPKSCEVLAWMEMPEPYGGDSDVD